jgi:hypothetical protein
MLFVPTKSVEKLFGKPLDALKPGEAGPTVQGDVAYVGKDLPATNVVAVLEGSDPALRGEYVALGAHNDAIGIVAPVDHDSLRAYNTVMRPRGANDTPRPPTAEEAARIKGMLDSLRRLRPARLDSIVNGADDDGSGSMGLLELAESVARGSVRPKRSLIFVWHTGEESGLQGSRWFTDHPTVPRDSIVAQLNIDMVGRGGANDFTGVTKAGAPIHGGPGYVQLIGSRRLSTELGDLAESVNTANGNPLTFDYSLDANGHPQNIYCRSDHYMYARYGIPIIFFTTGGHADYHQVTDEPQYIDYNRMEAVGKLVYGIAEKVGNLDHRVVVDKPKPNPRGACQQ